MKSVALLRALGFFLLASMVLGCGYSEEEWQAQLAKYGRLEGEHRKQGKELARVNEQLKAAIDKVRALQSSLKALGVDMDKLNADLASRQTQISNLNATLQEREKALAEYKRRAAALERIKRRFELLRQKLTALTNLGLKVTIRNNRMLISLPGDVLFASGKDRLKTEGEKILDQLAQIINNDSSLRSRYYQVAGHTDNVSLRGGTFYDNWGLSLMRARQVLVYLINPKQGALPEARWSAAGFGSTDPVSTNDTPEGRQKNRRCEVIVVPSAEEMLDLKNITQ